MENEKQLKLTHMCLLREVHSVKMDDDTKNSWYIYVCMFVLPVSILNYFVFASYSFNILFVFDSQHFNGIFYKYVWQQSRVEGKSTNDVNYVPTFGNADK